MINTWQQIVEQHAAAVEKAARKPPAREYKRCAKCGKLLSLNYFYSRPDVGDGYRSKCKTCMNNEAQKQGTKALEK